MDEVTDIEVGSPRPEDVIANEEYLDFSVRQFVMFQKSRKTQRGKKTPFLERFRVKSVEDYTNHWKEHNAVFNGPKGGSRVKSCVPEPVSRKTHLQRMRRCFFGTCLRALPTKVEDGRWGTSESVGREVARNLRVWLRHQRRLWDKCTARPGDQLARDPGGETQVGIKERASGRFYRSRPPMAIILESVHAIVAFYLRCRRCTSRHMEL